MKEVEKDTDVKSSHSPTTTNNVDEPHKEHSEDIISCSGDSDSGIANNGKSSSEDIEEFSKVIDHRDTPEKREGAIGSDTISLTDVSSVNTDVEGSNEVLNSLISYPQQPEKLGADDSIANGILKESDPKLEKLGANDSIANAMLKESDPKLEKLGANDSIACLLYTSPSPRDS